jgi:hypothetical protein
MKTFISIVFILSLLMGCKDPKPVQTQVSSPTPPPAPQSTPSPESLVKAREADAALLKQSEAGAAVIASVKAKYPSISGIEVSLFGEATSTPSVGVYLPEPALLALTESQISALSAYLRSQIFKVRSNPSDFMTIPSTAPFYLRAHQNVSGIRSEAWFIGVGRMEEGKFFYDRIAFKGNDYE